MSYIVYKTFGKQEYAYQTTQVKDKKTNKWKQKQKYLGVVINKEKQIFEKKNKIKAEQKKQEEIILDYGDTYFINELLKKDNKILSMIKNVFGNKTDTLLSLIIYRIVNGSAMQYTENWYNSNIVKLLFPKANVASQQISTFLKFLSKESLQQEFFKQYVKILTNSNKENGVIIDSTGLPNEINIPITEWGHHNDKIEKETRLIFAVDKETKLPLYFRYVAGNINDVSTLKNTIQEIKQLGIKTNISIIDAGYYSENNILDLYSNNIDFLIRLPAGRIIYKNLVQEHIKDIENIKYATKYNKRGLFIKKVPIKLYEDKNNAFAYIVCDPERKGKEVSKILLNKDVDTDISILEDSLNNCGIFILVSNLNIDINEIISLYYSRQIVEQLFGITKNDLNILPIRIHSEDTFRGFMLLTFMSLIVYLIIKNNLKNIDTIEGVLGTMRNLKCKVYKGNEIIVSETNKQQKSILEIVKD